MESINTYEVVEYKDLKDFWEKHGVRKFNEINEVKNESKQNQQNL